MASQNDALEGMAPQDLELEDVAMTVVVERPALAEIEAARKRLEGVVLHTPLVPLLAADGSRVEPPILLKPEIHQVVTSFKIRGVYNAVACMTDEQRSRGVMTVSAGNTAQALAWAARAFSVPARSLMPETAPRTKIERVRAMGAEPILVPVDEVFAFLKQHRWLEQPYAFVHPWTDRDVLIGHGSLGLEIADDLVGVDSVYLPVGGGGLLGGTASALLARQPSVRIVAVEPEGCPALKTALDRGRPVEVACNTICDGIAVPYITEEMFPLLSELVDEVVLVSESDTRAALRTLALRHKMIIEPAGAITVAAAKQDRANVSGPSVAVLSGGSVDTEKLTAWLA
jgi:threonine dehydratase